MSHDKNQDKEKIIAHIHSIFSSFLKKDRQAIKNAHTNDWVGFMGPSTKIERGIDDYMVNVDKSLESFNGVGYEILDHEIQIYGEIAIVYYTARYDYKDEKGETKPFPLRSVDIYKRTDNDWIQAGSHITPMPSGGAWGEGE